MKVIPVREFRNQSAAVLDAVERGECFVITRNGTAVAQVQPVRQRRAPTAADLVAVHRRLPVVTLAELRADSDAVFGDERL